MTVAAHFNTRRGLLALLLENFILKQQIPVNTLPLLLVLAGCFVLRALLHYFRELFGFRGPMPYQGRELAFKLGLQGRQVSQFAKIFMGLATLFLERDLALVEINPLVITTAGELVCLDGKLSIDSNALFRQPELREMHDPSQEDAREASAAQWELNYVALEGNIGCMVNGAAVVIITQAMVREENTNAQAPLLRRVVSIVSNGSTAPSTGNNHNTGDCLKFTSHAPLSRITSLPRGSEAA